MYKKKSTQLKFLKEKFVRKKWFKNRETSHKNTANFPVMNVGNSPQIVCMEMLKARPDHT